ncbi:hypothetical protein GCM10020220_086100 [Nonomuraea rubra]
MYLAEVSSGDSTWKTRSASFGVALSPRSARDTVHLAVPPEAVYVTGPTSVQLQPPPLWRYREAFSSKKSAPAPPWAKPVAGLRSVST